MNDAEIKMHQETIDKLDQEAACWLLRFAPSGHPFFDMSVPEVSEYFDKRYKALGGMTPAISKSMGGIE